MTVLHGHVSPETAWVCESYPYGFRLRCQIRYWIETKKGFGQRVFSQTTNPKKPGTVWNKPKVSTYMEVRVLYLDDQGRVQNTGLHTYDSTTAIDTFERTYGEVLTGEYEQQALRMLKRVAARMEAPREVRSS